MRRAELLPDRLEPVARAERHRRASPAGRAAGRRRRRRRRRTQASTSSADRERRAGVVLHPAQHRAGRAASTAPSTATIRPPRPPSVSQPVSRWGWWSGCDDGQRLEQRGGVEVGVRGRARRCRVSSPAAVTSRTAKPRWLRCTAIDAAAETAASSEEAMPWPRWATQPVVEEERGPRLPGLLLAAHHQLTDRGRAAPVHAAQVVAAAVLADGDVLGAADREGPRPVVAGAGPGAAERDRGQRDGARGDGQRDGGPERAAELDQAERVADPHRHRADLEAAAHVGADLVGHLRGASRGRCPRARSAAGCRARRGRGPRAAATPLGVRPSLVEGQADPGRLAGGDQLRGDGADQREPVAAAADDSDGDQRQREHAGRRPGSASAGRARSRRRSR